jgi:hypothetical protein
VGGVVRGRRDKVWCSRDAQAVARAKGEGPGKEVGRGVVHNLDLFNQIWGIRRFV